MHFLVLHGPNLNLLGQREPHIYGLETLEQVNKRIQAYARDRGVTVEIHQSNHEGELIDLLHAARGRCQGVVINPGGLSHTSVALRDAVTATELPVVEVHLSNVHSREPFRQRLVTAGACWGVISGLGSLGYLLALEALIQRLGGQR